MKNQDNSNDRDLTVVGTKMTKSAAEKLQSAAQRMGLRNSYTLLQMITDCIIRFMDEPTSASRELIDLIEQFDGFAAWKDYSSICRVERPEIMEIVKAIYFVREKGSGKMESYAELVEFNDLKWLGGFSVNNNVNDIITATLKGTRPMLLRRLQRVMKEQGLRHITGAIALLIAEHYREDDDEFIRSLFADNERSDYGGAGKVAPEQKNKHRRRDLSGCKEEQKIIKFNHQNQNNYES